MRKTCANSFPFCSANFIHFSPYLYFYRDAHGNEVDFIFEAGRKLIPIEVKASKTFHKDFLKNLEFFKSLAGDRFDQGFLIYAGDQEQKIYDFQVLNYAHSHQVMGN